MILKRVSVIVTLHIAGRGAVDRKKEEAGDC